MREYLERRVVLNPVGQRLRIYVVLIAIGELLLGQMLAKVLLSAILVPPVIYLLVGLGRRLDR